MKGPLQVLFLYTIKRVVFIVDISDTFMYGQSRNSTTFKMELKYYW